MGALTKLLGTNRHKSFSNLSRFRASQIQSKRLIVLQPVFTARQEQSFEVTTFELTQSSLTKQTTKASSANIILAKGFNADLTGLIKLILASHTPRKRKIIEAKTLFSKFHGLTFFFYIFYCRLATGPKALHLICTESPKYNVK